jgi:hypothetical protein
MSLRSKITMAETKESVRNSAHKVTKKRSLINHYFDIDLLVDIRKITMLSDYNNNEKGTLIKELMTEKDIPYSSLGNGTNRMGILIDGFAVKIALDKDGMIDNLREMLYTKPLQPICCPARKTRTEQHLNTPIQNYYPRMKTLN